MGTTPIYAIRYPDPTTKANQLPTSFQNLALDVERSLSTALIPPASPAPVYVAPSLAARDAFWGVPATGADQITLQNRGAITVRTDRGWTEQYFGLYNVTTNPGGALVTAGWYPISGELPFIKLGMSAAQNVTTGGATTAVLWDVEFSDRLNWHDLATNSQRVTVQVPGRYRVNWKLSHRSTVATQLLAGQIGVSGVKIANSLTTVPGNTVGFVYASGDETVELSAGAYVEILAASNLAQALEVASSMAQVSYLGPR